MADHENISRPTALQSRLAMWLGSEGAAGACVISGVPCPFPQEAATMAGACSARRAEFSSGRACARVALAQLGSAPAAIPVGQLGGPVWPSGFCGSIAHDSCIAVAVAGRGTVWQQLGVDIHSLDHGVPDDALPLVVAATEELPLSVLPKREAASLLFCIKEAAIKALSPNLAGLIDFADLHSETTGHRFVVRHLGLPSLVVRGHWDIVAGFLTALAIVPAAGEPDIWARGDVG